MTTEEPTAAGGPLSKPAAIALAVFGAVLFSAGVLGDSLVVGAALMATGVVVAAIAAVAILPTGNPQPDEASADPAEAEVSA